MTREEMMNNVIRVYGHEADKTIKFCIMAEDTNKSDYEVQCAYMGLICGRR